jgi:hypothetical protein
VRAYPEAAPAPTLKATRKEEEEEEGPRLLHPGPPSRGSLPPSNQVQTILSVSRRTVVSPLAFTVKCAWNLTKALDPSDPCATARKRSVSVSTSTSPCLTALMFSESLFLKLAV